MAKTRDYVKWIETNLRPDVYCVGTLKQAVKIWRNGSPIWVPLKEETIRQRASQFTARLSEALYGKTIYQRFKLLVPNAITLEGNGNGRSIQSAFRSKKKVRYHLNILLRKPESMAFDAFRRKINKVWRSCDWTMPDIKIMERSGKCVSYSLKDGPESLVTETLNFGNELF